MSRVAELTNAHYGLDAPAVVIGNAVGEIRPHGG